MRLLLLFPQIERMRDNREKGRRGNKGDWEVTYYLLQNVSEKALALQPRDDSERSVQQRQL